MTTSLDRSGEWETQAEVDACLAETGVSKNQVVRWRRDGLLPKEVEQDSAYHGSVVRFPVGTCTQIRVAHQLFLRKKRTEYVGQWLWWLGYPVTDDHWRPRLEGAGRLLDRVAPMIAGRAIGSDRRDDHETFYDRAARALTSKSNIVLSRIRRRIDADRMPTVLRVFGETAAGEFDGFESANLGQEHSSDRMSVIQALDLANASKHSILGHKVNAVELLPIGLKDVAIAMSMGNFTQIAKASEADIGQARNDARHALLIGYYLYEGNRWVYGDGAFGMRLIAWIVRKTPMLIMSLLTLVMFRLRQVPNAVQSSEQILQLAQGAYSNWIQSKELERLWLSDPRFSKILDPKRMKTAFADEVALKRWQSELKAIIDEGAAKLRTGSIDDGQEIGKTN
jgi:hypothetical protein